MKLVVNGKERLVEAGPLTSLLHVLREELGFVGAKAGCEHGSCGTCTVLIDGEPRRSCLTPVGAIEGASITTAEALGDPANLSVVQAAFDEHYAAQCGFCTPGMLLAATALIERKGGPVDRDEVVEALGGHYCRCTGYVKIVDAVVAASRGETGARAPSTLEIRAGGLVKAVGASLPRYDGIDHVTARSRFVDDFSLPGMLWAKAFRSPVASARIVRLDTTRAEAMPGVHAVITHADVPNNVVGHQEVWGIAPDEPLLAEHEVRFAGQLIAVVAAETEAQALDAVQAIELELEERTPFLDVRNAWDAGRPQVTPDGNVFFYYPDQPQRQIRKGNVDEAFAAADVIVEGVYRPGAIEQAPAEPAAALAIPEPNGRVTIHSTSQALYYSMDITARHLRMPMGMLKFVGGTVGGGFGGKIDTKTEPITAVLALKTQRPVKWRHTREEEMLWSRARGRSLMALRRGPGIATIEYPTGMNQGGDPSQAWIKVKPDGHVDVFSGTVDVGQGSKTVHTQIAADMIGVPYDTVTMNNFDTDTSPVSFGTFASRGTFIDGNAIAVAAYRTRQRLLEVASRMMEVDPEDLEIADRDVAVLGAPERKVSVAEIAATASWTYGEMIVGSGAWMFPHVEPDKETGECEPHAAISYASCVADVEVDDETGEVRVTNLVQVYDVGRAINPTLVEGQIQGGAVMGLGLALLEESYPYYPELSHRGPEFGAYAAPGMADLPELKNVVLEDPDPVGPFGAKAVGEMANNAQSPAIVAAIHDAVGVWVTELPARPERVLRALDESRQPRRDGRRVIYDEHLSVAAVSTAANRPEGAWRFPLVSE